MVVIFIKIFGINRLLILVVCICLIFFDICVIIFLVLIVKCEFFMKIVKFLICIFCIVSIERLRCITVEDRRDLMFYMYGRLLISTERS